MDPWKPKKNNSNGPEAIIQDEIIGKLRKYEWFVKSTHGNAFQSGLPDLFAAHPLHGSRWIEVKNPLDYSFTAAQIHDFPRMSAAGVGIWILFSAEAEEMQKLFKPANWAAIFHNKVYSFRRG